MGFATPIDEWFKDKLKDYFIIYLDEERLRKALTDFIVAYDKMTPEDRKKHGYKLITTQPVDMAPHTYHIETVAKLI